jgi:hypothetical protein
VGPGLLPELVHAVEVHLPAFLPPLAGHHVVARASCRVYDFPCAISLRIAMSKACSATSFLSRAFSFHENGGGAYAPLNSYITRTHSRGAHPYSHYEQANLNTMKDYLSKALNIVRRAEPIHAIRQIAMLLPWLLRGHSAIRVDYPPKQTPRYNYGETPHADIFDLLIKHKCKYRDVLRKFLHHSNEFCAIAKRESDVQVPSDPCWINGYLPGLDSVALYGLLSDLNPAKYIEIGSGHSTRFARKAISNGNLKTQIISIDPQPRADIESLCDHITRRPLEEVDLSLFDGLEPGDIVFFDGSHRVFTNSDVTVFFLEVLPKLTSGVYIQIHDIFLPWDYSPDVVGHSYSEQYMLAVLLLFGAEKFEVVLPNMFISRDRTLASVLDPLWQHPSMAGIEPHGGSFWMRKL